MNPIEVDWLLARPGEHPAVHGASIGMTDGRIGTVVPVRPPGNGLIALPGIVNAHDHAKAFRSSALGGFDKALESWTFYLGLAPAVDARLAAATSLARSALRGVGRVMVHYTRLQGLTDPVSEAQQVSDAARDVGVQVGFAVAMRDRNPLAYGDTETVLAQMPEDIRAPVRSRMAGPPVPHSAQIALADEIALRCHRPGFNVQYGPRGVQWCSHEMLVAIAEASLRNGRQVHMHLLETRYQREWADREHPQGVVRYLKDIGLLGPRLTLAHCAWCRPDELDLIAESGAAISVNTSSNLALRSGLAPVADMLKAGCRVAMGLDGQAFDDDDDALREVRLLYHLHKGWGYETRIGIDRAWRLACEHGPAVVSGLAGGGMIAEGAPGDMLVLDGNSVMDDRIFDEVDPFEYVMSRAHAGHIRKVIVAGKSIVDDGRVLGVDYPAMMAELMSACRSRADGDAAWRATVRRMDAALKPFYLGASHMGCG